MSLSRGIANADGRAFGGYRRVISAIENRDPPARPHRRAAPVVDRIGTGLSRCYYSMGLPAPPGTQIFGYDNPMARSSLDPLGSRSRVRRLPERSRRVQGEPARRSG